MNTQKVTFIRSASSKKDFLDDGRAAGIGTHDELLENCQVYREIYDSQFKKEAAQA